MALATRLCEAIPFWKSVRRRDSRAQGQRERRRRGAETVKGEKRGWKGPGGLRTIHPHAAGIDVGASSHFVAVPPGSDAEGQDVREFEAFTCGLRSVAQWLRRCGVTTVAMESTGVYWIPLFELLEAEGFEVLLVDARHVKNVPGRKSDVRDCQWLQELHSYGLLSGAFRPKE